MRVAFVGKGGSGKTTLTSLFARFLASKEYPVLAIDADINQHLREAVGIKEEIPTMADHSAFIREYLRGENKRIESLQRMVKTTPPGTGSKLLKVLEPNDIFERASKLVDGVRLMTVGPLGEEDLGLACFHGKIGSLELMLSHLDDRDEFVLVDMTAGADAFASGLFAKFDMTFLIVEPTIKGLVVYKQYKEYSKGYHVPLLAIGNKVMDSDDRKFLQKNLKDDLLAFFKYSNFIKKQEKGANQNFSKLEKENLAVLEKMLEALKKVKPDRNKRYQYTVDFHMLNAQDWMNKLYDYDFTKQVDPKFTWPEN